MMAGVYTDVFQGSLMVLAAVAVFAYAMSAGGGFGQVVHSIAASPRFGRPFLEPLGGALRRSPRWASSSSSGSACSASRTCSTSST